LPSYSLVKKSQARYTQERKDAQMFALLLAATLNIGVYYTYPPESIVLHNANGKEIAVKTKIDIREAINAILNQAEAIINKEIFDNKSAIKFKLAFTKQWNIKNPPIYKDINIPHAVDVAKIWPLVDELERPAEADVYITLFRPALAYFDSKEGRMKGAAGVAYGNLYFGQQMALQIGLGTPASDGDVSLLLHELGHLLDQGHPSEKLCAETKIIMCPRGRVSIVLDELYKKAWHDFYYQKTGQGFKPSQ